MAHASGQWKDNWDETRRHFIDWWNHRGLVVGSWGAPQVDEPIVPTGDPGVLPTVEERLCNAKWRAESNHWALARQRFPLDTLPVSGTNIGPGSLALILGSVPGFSPSTVWYHPWITDPEACPKLTFDPSNKWFGIHADTMRASAQLAAGRYMVGCPDLIENIDILASLRDSQTLLIDMVERPEWVKEKLWEINEVWFAVYDRLYEIIKLPDGSSCFDAFRVWGPGKTAKVQCDASAMFSLKMFREFVEPALSAQCQWLDHSMFHLDGHQCIQHLDSLLEIEALDAIEWTPDPQVPGGGSPQWYDLYKRIKNAGKSVQAIGVNHDEIVPLLDAVGPEGMYIMTGFDMKQAEQIAKMIEPYRRGIVGH